MPVPGITGQVDGIAIRGKVTDAAPDTCFPAVQIWDRLNTAGAAPTYIFNVVTADNTLKTLGDGIRYNYVQGDGVTGNTIVNTVGHPVYCGTLSDPTVPVRVTNSTGVAVGPNTHSGYGTP